MGSNPSEPKSPHLPVDGVSWDDCQGFLATLNQKYRVKGMTFALPHESEWESACRGGTTSPWSFGADPALLGEYAWFLGNSQGTKHPVGQKKPNSLGLYDMQGNVWEWCSNWYQAPLAIPAGPPTDKRRVVRGGSWKENSVRCRPASRGAMTGANPGFGFRVMCTPKDVSTASTQPIQSSAGRKGPRQYKLQFKSPEDLKQFVMADGSQVGVRNGLLGIGKGYVTFGTYFKSISSARIIGGIAPPAKRELRASVGQINMILNWDWANRDENHFRYCMNTSKGNRRHPTKPYALTPGKFHEIQVKQEGGKVFVLIDGKPHFETQGTLEGTVSIYPGPRSQIVVKEIVIEGEPDLSRQVTGPSPDNLY